jgi:hypothetical protein
MPVTGHKAYTGKEEEGEIVKYFMQALCSYFFSFLGN